MMAKRTLNAIESDLAKANADHDANVARMEASAKRRHELTLELESFSEVDIPPEVVVEPVHE